MTFRKTKKGPEFLQIIFSIIIKELSVYPFRISDIFRITTYSLWRIYSQKIWEIHETNSLSYYSLVNSSLQNIYSHLGIFTPIFLDLRL